MNVRVATYNLFEGAGGAYNRLVEFVRTSGLDVLCLQEVNGWQDNDFARLKDFTDKILFAAYAYGNSNTEFKLATVSKQAIVNRTLHAEAFWHGALETRVRLGNKEVSVINVHLDPWKEESREAEIARLLAAVQPGQPTIITGDFNSLSRQDNYPPELLQQLQAKGISKFGTQQLEFRVIDRILQAGFVDAAALKGVMEPTVPSAFNQDRDHEVPVRVDYVFVSPDLAPLVTAVELMKMDLTDAISDHYPLVVTFNMGGENATTPAPAGGDPKNGAPGPKGRSEAIFGEEAGKGVPAGVVVPPMGSPPAGAGDDAGDDVPKEDVIKPDGTMDIAHDPNEVPPPAAIPEPPQLPFAPAPTPVPAPPEPPQPVPEPPKEPVKPWVPEGYENFNYDAARHAHEQPQQPPEPPAEQPQQPPKDPPKPPDGEVTMWSHDQKT